MSRTRPWPAGTWDGCLASCHISRALRDGLDAHALLVAALMLEMDLASDRREDREVAAEVSARAGEEGHATLTDDDRASRYDLAITDLDAEPLADAVAAVLRTRARLLVCHFSYSSFFALGRVVLDRVVLGLAAVSSAFLAGALGAAFAAGLVDLAAVFG